VLAKDDATRARLDTVLYTASEGLRALAVLLAPVMPKATAKLWEALGAEELLGALGQQRVREAGVWGALTPGTVIRPLEALFPRIEEAESSASGAA
jgi:methionyl-tRNA synthetase